MVYRASALRGLAITQMVFAALMITFGAACIFSVNHWSSRVGFGVWVGSWVLITGILGYIGAKDDARPNKCLTGCFMGFSIAGCVKVASMFICYCIALSEFSNKIRKCRDDYYNDNYYNDYYPTSSYNYRRYHSYDDYDCSTAKIGAGLGSCQLIFSLVVFFVALASSIYCCMAVCGESSSGHVVPSYQAAMYMHPQQMYPGGQAGVVVIQPDGAMAPIPHGYMVAGQQGAFMPPRPGVPGQQPAGYWVMPSGPNPAPSATSTSRAGASGATATAQLQYQQQLKEHERPPPYSYSAQTGNAPPSASASGVTEDVPGVMTI
ncbi:uncharacterized protein [Porites lutea]|uniref:uncharacterized protein n=1 Tax=Porites lutea TaxID=51062 RepID=UPI003CC6D621